MSSDTEMISLLERYLLAADKEAFFATLVKGSDTYKRLRAVDHLNRHGLKLPDDTKKYVEELLASSDSRKSTLVSFKTQLLQIEADKDEAKRKKRLQKFNEDFFQCRFDHQRPATVQCDRNMASGKEEALPSTYACAPNLSADSVVRRALLPDGDDDALELDELQSDFYDRLPLDQVLARRGVDGFRSVLLGLQSFTHVTGVGDVLRRFGDAWRAQHEGASTGTLGLLGSDVYYKLTLAQLAELETAVPDARGDAAVAAAKFRKAFEADLAKAADADAEPAERRAVLERMLAWADGQRDSAASLSLRAQVLRETLEADLLANRVDEAVFARYIANPLRGERGVYPAPPPGTPPVRPCEDWYEVHRFPRERWQPTERRLVSQCLQQLLGDAGRAAARVRAYEPHLDRDFLRREHCRARLLSGADAADATEVFGERGLGELREERRLRFVASNARSFAPGQRVDLQLEVKNVPVVAVSVYEMDTANYYQRSQTPLDSRVDLDGLVPSKRLERAVDAAPVVSQVIEFRDLLEARRGVYVVEFVGGGLCSRAVVRVGGLTVVRQSLSKGVLLHIVDEERRICHGAATGLLVDGRTMRPQESLGWGILVPYAEQPRYETGVVLHDGYAQLYDLAVPPESVALEVGLVVNEEAVAAGGAVQLLLLPQVLVCGQRVGLVSLRRARATVTALSEDGVPNVSAFDDLPLDKRGKAVPLRYLVPPRTQRVEVRVTAEFYSSAQERYIDLACERSVSVDGKRGQRVFQDVYLRPDGPASDDYVLEVLGKNGEPYPKRRVQLELTPVFRMSNVTAACETDAEGRVRLAGARGCVREVRVASGDGVASRFSVDDDHGLGALPWSYDVVEGEELLLPSGARDGAFDARRYELLRIARGYGPIDVLADVTSLVRGRDGVLCVAGLEEGRYLFTYRDVGMRRTVDIRVLRGERWAASPKTYLSTRRGLRRLENPGMALSTRGFRLDAATGAAELTVSAADMESVEVHALAFTHFPRTLDELRSQLGSAWGGDRGEDFALALARNAYLSEKRLGDEVQYVLERKRRRPFMGCTLEKPPGLLHRHFLRETKEDAERLQTGKDFAEEVHHANMKMKARGAVMECEDAMEECEYITRGPPEVAICPPHPSAYNNDYVKMPAPPAVPPGDYNITRLGSFLASAGWCAVGIAPDAATGRVQLTVPLDAGYTTLVTVARDGRGGAVVETHGLPVSARPRVDVRLGESKSADRVYVQARLAQCLQRGGVYEARDATSTDMRLVSDTATVLKALRTLGMHRGMDEWDFLGRWAALSPRERLRKYDKYMSHELNIFAYFKDREFFDAVVRPHLASKTRKGVVDWFLLGDTAALAPYVTNVALLEPLNMLERTLLVAALSASHPEECAAVARAVRDEVGPDSDRPQSQYERLFDAVLNDREQQPDPPRQTMGGAAPLYGANTISRGRVPCTAKQPPAGLLARSRQYMAAPQAEQLLCAAVDEADEADSGAAVVQRKYRAVEVTHEYGERQYYGGAAALTPANHFWADALEFFAGPGAAGGAAFLTANFVYATSSVAESLLAAGLLGVPLDKAEHASERAGQGLRVTAGAPCVVFSREIQERGGERADLDVLVTQRLCDPNDMYTTAGGVRALKAVGEFLTGKLYMARVAVTNATESEVKLSVVTEVPQGAVPVVRAEYAGTEERALEPLSTQTLEFFFYFPEAGDFTCFPASVSEGGRLVASAKPCGTLRVVREPTAAKMETIADILNQGSKADILAFMARENLRKRDVFTFDSIYWLLSDADFYRDVVALLRRRQHFDQTVWSYSILHGDSATFAEFLGWRYRAAPPRLRVVDAAAPEPVRHVACGLLRLDAFQYREYNPLVNARAHDIGPSKVNIRNREFRETYDGFLRYLFQKTPALTTRDYVYWCTYLLLQDRVEEALAMHAAHVAGAPAAGGDADADSDADLALQRDYLAAYLDLYTGAPDFAVAREVAARYLTYPVFTWRNRFIEVLNQVAESGADALAKAGGADAVTGADRNAAQADTEPYLACELDGARVKVSFSNVASATVRFYRIDLEVLFSQNPFLDAADMDYSYVAANETATVQLGDAAPLLRTHSVDIPAALARANLIVQVSSGAATASATYFPNAMNVMVLRNYGQVRVLSAADGRPMPLVYVKAFARRRDGDVVFFKDGYTDLRGTVEYASVHGGRDKLDEVDEFSLLVISDDAGAVLKRAQPPSRTAEAAVGESRVRATAVQQLQDRMLADGAGKYCVQ